MKASFASKDTVETGLNFGEGWGEIMECSSVVHQFPKGKDGAEQQPPATMVRMLIQRTDDNGKHTSDDPVEEFFGCGSIEKFHPGVANDADDEEVEDQGDDLGAEGNCIYSDGSKLNKKSKWVIFLNHAEAKGFKPEVLGKGFLPDFVGTKGFFTSIALPKEADRTYKRDPKALVLQQITKFPYDKKGAGKSAAAAKESAKGKGASAAAANTEAEAASESTGANVNDEVGALGTQILVEMARKMAGQTLAKDKIPSKLIAIFAQGIKDVRGPIPAKEQKPVIAIFKSDEWLAEQCDNLEYGFADGVISFPKA